MPKTNFDQYRDPNGVIDFERAYREKYNYGGGSNVECEFFGLISQQEINHTDAQAAHIFAHGITLGAMNRDIKKLIARTMEVMALTFDMERPELSKHIERIKKKAQNIVEPKKAGV